MESRILAIRNSSPESQRVIDVLNEIVDSCSYMGDLGLFVDDASNVYYCPKRREFLARVVRDVEFDDTSETSTQVHIYRVNSETFQWERAIAGLAASKLPSKVKEKRASFVDGVLAGISLHKLSM